MRPDGLRYLRNELKTKNGHFFEISLSVGVCTFLVDCNVSFRIIDNNSFETGEAPSIRVKYFCADQSDTHAEF